MHLAFLKKNINNRIVEAKKDTIVEEKKEKLPKEQINYNIVKNILDYDFNNKTKFSKINNIILSFTSTIERFISDEFLLYIDNLYKQEILPKYTFINIYDKVTTLLNKVPSLFNKFTSQSNKVNIEERINLLQTKYSNLFVNMCDDLGPIIKILGLYDLHNKYNINDNDKIIIIDNECIISNKLTFYYELCYEIYNCEFIAVNNNQYDNLFFDNLESNVSSSASYSIKYKYISKLYNFYKELKDKMNDDLIVSLFYKKENLYSCGININLTGINMNLTDVISDMNNNIIFEINNIEERYLLANISNINNKIKVDDLDIKNVLISYFNENIAIVTIIFFQDIEDNIILNSNNKVVNIENLKLSKNSRKHTIFVNIEMMLNKQTIENLNINIFQTNKTNLISRNKFYSITSILNYIPYLNYVFFNDNDIIKFIETMYPIQIVRCYNRLNIGAYKADFFRVLYIYRNGGLYFDCKNVLYDNIYNYLCKDKFFIRDTKLESIYNGIMYCKNKHIELYFNYIISIMLNIIKLNYTNYPEGITGSKLLFKLTNEPASLYKTPHKFDNLSEYILANKRIIVNCSYYNYYYDDNYLQNYSYTSLWKSQKVFNNVYEYNKIDFVDHIVWINLDKSTKRQKHMVGLLKNINIPSTRISAIDGSKGDLRKMMKDLNIDTIYTSNPEIGCTLSHIKAISHLSTLPGEYFLVLEDDVTLDNLCLFDITLKDIIKTCPKFDILQLHSITENVIPYIKSVDDFQITKKDFNPFKTWSTASYVISRQGIQNFMKKKGYFINNKIMIIDKKFDIADIYTYRNMVIYSYKYNFFSTQEYDSDIHNDHLAAHKTSLNHNLNRLIHDSLIIKLKNENIKTVSNANNKVNNNISKIIFR